MLHTAFLVALLGGSSTADAAIPLEVAAGLSGDNWTVRTQDERRYGLRGLSFRLRPYIGKKAGFLADLSYSKPLRGAERGRDPLYLPKVYDKTRGTDVLLGAARRFEVADKLAVKAGGGVHLNVMDLSEESLRSWNNVSLGLGLTGDCAYTLGDHTFIGANLNFNLGFLDMIHDTGKLTTLMGTHLGAHFGVRL